MTFFVECRVAFDFRPARDWAPSGPKLSQSRSAVVRPSDRSVGFGFVGLGQVRFLVFAAHPPGEGSTGIHRNGRDMDLTLIASGKASGRDEGDG